MPTDLLREGASWTEENGIVTDLRRTGTLQLTGADAIALANSAVMSGQVPPKGHQVIVNGSRLVAVVRHFDQIDADKVDFVVLYKRTGDLGKPIIRGGTSVTSIQTQKDILGTPISVFHKGVTQGGEVTIEIARSVLEYSLLEATNTPGVLSQQYGSKVNLNAWQGGAPGTWKCASVTFEEVDRTSNPQQWQMTYTFEYNPDGWNPAVAFIDPETGKPPPDLISGLGIKTVEGFAKLDFSGKFPT